MLSYGNPSIIELWLKKKGKFHKTTSYQTVEKSNMGFD